MKHTLVVLLFPLLLYTAAAQDSSTAETGRIAGAVTDAETRQPLPGVRVVVLSTGFGAVSAHDGTFTIPDVPAGRYSLTATLPGYRPQSVTDIVVMPRRTAQCAIGLLLNHYEMDDIVVQAGAFDNTGAPGLTSSTTLGNQDIARTPGIPDVFRRLHAVAGAGRTDESSAALIARGGDPQENLTLIENIEIISPFHFAGLDGNTAGGMSIIEPRLIDRVQLSTGGFEPAYGDKLSAVTRITLREPEKQRVSGDLSLDMGGFGAVASGPLTEQASWLVSCRRSVMDLLLGMLDMDFNPRTWDLHTKLLYTPSARHRFTLYGMYAQDDITGSAEDADEPGDASYSAIDKSQYAVGMNWMWLYSDGYLLTTPFVNSTDWSLAYGPMNDRERFGSTNRERHAGIRVELLHRIDEGHRFSVGGEARSIEAAYTAWAATDTLTTGVVAPAYRLAFGPELSSKYAAYFQYTWTPVPWATVTAGLRHDYFAYTDESTVSPRIAAVFPVHPRVTLSASGGLFTQFPGFHLLFLSPENRYLRPSKAVHYIGGIEYLPTDDLQLKAEVYYKDLYHLPVTDGDTGKVYRSTGSGFAGGVELTLTQRLSDRLYLLLNYTYSVSKRRDGENTRLYPFRFDRPHAANLMATFRPGGWWEFGVGCSYTTGAPYTPYDLSTRREIDGVWYADRAEHHSARYPDYFRVDLRIDRRFVFDTWNLRAYVELWNITNHGNVFEYRYTRDLDELQGDVLFPLTPMIGVVAEL